MPSTTEHTGSFTRVGATGLEFENKNNLNSLLTGGISRSVFRALSGGALVYFLDGETTGSLTRVTRVGTFLSGPAVQISEE